MTAERVRDWEARKALILGLFFTALMGSALVLGLVILDNRTRDAARDIHRIQQAWCQKFYPSGGDDYKGCLKEWGQ